MKVLWELQKGFVKDIIAQYPNPKPHYNTISSLVRVLQDKGIVGFTQYGNTYEYYPLLTKEDYRMSFMKEIVADYFDGSFTSAVASFVENEAMNPDDLDELVKLIKSR